MSSFGIYETRETMEGVGARINRAFPIPGRTHVDPFVLLDEFYVGEGGVPAHEHRGFEIITYMLEGALAHEDSTGISKRAREGGAMRMRTASGMRHSEHPGSDESAHGLQLWINLPREDKEREADYCDAEPDQLPVDTREGVQVTTVVGDGSPLDLRTDVSYEIVEAEEGATYEWRVDAGWSALVYVLEGTVSTPIGNIDQQSFAARDGAERTSDERDTFPIEVADDATVAVIAGQPLNEPISQRGPVVL